MKTSTHKEIEIVIAKRITHKDPIPKWQTEILRCGFGNDTAKFSAILCRVEDGFQKMERIYEAFGLSVEDESGGLYELSETAAWAEEAIESNWTIEDAYIYNP